MKKRLLAMGTLCCVIASTLLCPSFATNPETDAPVQEVTELAPVPEPEELLPAAEPEAAPISAPYGPFDDVPSDAYYAEAVAWAVERGVTNGVSASSFAPETACNRGQVAAFLWRAAGKPEPAGNGARFTDVGEDSAFYQAILWAVERGITNGTSDTTYSPQAPCTYGHVLTFLWRSKNSPKPATEPDPSYAERFFSDAVAWAAENGLLADISLDTGAECPRKDIVTFLYRGRDIPAAERAPEPEQPNPAEAEEAPAPEVRLRNMTLSADKTGTDKASIRANTGIAIRVRPEPENAPVGELTWTSSKREVATVDGSGYVWGNAPGHATIWAQASNGMRGVFFITVTEAPSGLDYARKALSYYYAHMKVPSSMVVDDVRYWADYHREGNILPSASRERANAVISLDNDFMVVLCTVRTLNSFGGVSSQKFLSLFDVTEGKVWHDLLSYSKSLYGGIDSPWNDIYNEALLLSIQTNDHYVPLTSEQIANIMAEIKK